MQIKTRAVSYLNPVVLKCSEPCGVAQKSKTLSPTMRRNWYGDYMPVDVLLRGILLLAPVNVEWISTP